MKRVLFVADSPFPLGPSQLLIQRMWQGSEKSAEFHVAFQQPGNPDWLGLMNVPCYLPSKWNTGTSQSIPADFDPSKYSSDGSRAGLNGVYALRNLIANLRPDSVYALGQRMARRVQFAISFLSRSIRSNIETIYCEFEKPCHNQLPSRWLGRMRGVRFDRIEVSHEILQQELVTCGVTEPIEIVANRVSPLWELAEYDASQRGQSRQVLRDRLGLPDSAIVAGTVAPLIARTRLKDLVWATDQLTAIRDDFHLAIFGCGSQYARLERFAELTEAPDHVHFLGEPDDALQLFQGLDIYWHSHLREPNPVNVLNAMAMEIPVISVLGIETSDVIKHLQTGFGVNFGARDEFARWSKYLIEQKESAERISQQGAEFARKHFTNCLFPDEKTDES